MKTIILYSILLPAFATIFSSCQKDEAELPPDSRFPLPLITKDLRGDDTISGRDPESFLGKFVVDLYYGPAVNPQKIDIVVIRNDDKTNVKTIKADVTSFPSSIEVTGTQLTTLFDSTIRLGDKFEIGADVTTINGQKFEAFPATGNPYGADTSTLPGSRFSIAYVADCVFDIASFSGWYTVEANTLEYNAGDSIEVRPGEGDTILITAWPHPNPVLGLVYHRWPMIVVVDPVTYEVTIPIQGVGEYCCGGPGVYLFEEGSGTVSPCGDRISLVVSLDAGYNYGPGYNNGVVPLELRK